MLLAAIELAARQDAFASRQVNAADLATDHVFGLARGRRLNLTATCPAARAADDQIDDDEDGDKKKELGHALFSTQDR